MKTNLPEQIAQIVRDWPEWSRAERRRLDEIIDEVLHYASDGLGNAFIKRFWWTYVEPRVGYHDSGEGPFDTFQEAVRFAHAEVGVPWKLLAAGGRYHVFVKNEEEEL